MGANCLVTPCPLCDISLDAYQEQADERRSAYSDLPVFNLSQLVAYAVGVDIKMLGFGRHLIDPEPLLEMNS